MPTAYYNYEDLSNSDRQYYEEGKFFTNASVQQEFAKDVKEFKQFCEDTLKWNLAEDGNNSWISYNAYDTDDVDLIRIAYKPSLKTWYSIGCSLICIYNENKYKPHFWLWDDKTSKCLIEKKTLETFITALEKWVEQ